VDQYVGRDVNHLSPRLTKLAFVTYSVNSSHRGVDLCRLIDFQYCRLVGRKPSQVRTGKDRVAEARRKGPLSSSGVWRSQCVARRDESATTHWRLTQLST